MQLIVVAGRAGETKVLPDGRIEYVGILRAEANNPSDLVSGDVSGIHGTDAIAP